MKLYIMIGSFVFFWFLRFFVPTAECDLTWFPYSMILYAVNQKFMFLLVTWDADSQTKSVKSMKVFFYHLAGLMSHELYGQSSLRALSVWFSYRFIKIVLHRERLSVKSFLFLAALRRDDRQGAKYHSKCKQGRIPRKKNSIEILLVPGEYSFQT